MRTKAIGLAFVLMFGMGLSALADDPDREVKVLDVAVGAPAITVKGSVQGNHYIDYKVHVGAGQKLKVTLMTDSGANYFNILPPGSRDVAIYNSSMEGNSFHRVLDEEGNYKIRVYLERSAARRNEKARYTLEVLLKYPQEGHRGNASGHATPYGHGDAKAPGTNYHATGNLPCSGGEGHPTTQCPFGVIREGGGTATVTVTKPDGRKRSLFFERGKAIGCDQSQADWGGEFRAHREGDMTIIRIGAERYEVIDAIVFGG